VCANRADNIVFGLPLVLHKANQIIEEGTKQKGPHALKNYVLIKGTEDT
jgi:hypothetical protein